MNKTTTLIYHEWAELFEEMSPADVKTVILALLHYDSTEKEQDVCFENKLVNAVYKMMLEKTKKNHLLYAEKCEKLAKNGALGGRPRKTENPEKAERKGKEGKGKEGKGKDRSGVEVEGTPSLSEIKAFCSAEGLAAIDADRFFDYYQSQNWLINGQPMDWQARARLWNSQDKESKKPKQTEFQNFQQRDNDWNTLEKELIKK